MLKVESSLSNGTKAPVASGKHTSRSAHVVEEIRKRFLNEEYAVNKDLYDEVDVERLRNNEWFIKRYLLAARRNPDEAFEMLKNTLIWRKNVQISTTPISAFPKEFFQIGGLFQYENDLEGNPVIYMRIRMHRKIVELQEPIQQFLFYIINKVDLETNCNGAVILFDCSGAGYANMDLDMLKVLTEVAFKYFPFCINKVIVYELSWMLNAFRRIAMTIIPAAFAKIVHFATKDDITNYIARENLPDFMGGTCKRDYRYVPEGCPDVDSVALERGFSMNDVERIKAIFNPYLDEALAAIAARKEEEEKQKAIEGLITSKVKNQEDEVHGEGDDGGEEDTAISGSVAIVRAKGKSFDEFASLYPQNVIVFRRTAISADQWPSDKAEFVLTGTVLLRNNHQSKSLAFKVQSTNPTEYSVTPNLGVILPGAFICITITVNSTANSAALSNDKFMILLCAEIALERDLANWRQFNRLFVEQADKVHSHKLKAKIGDEKGELGGGRTLHEGTQLVTRLEREVVHLKSKCGRLEQRQKWLNFITLVLACLALFLVAWPLCSSQQTSWPLFPGLLNSCSRGAETKQEL